ncbi:OLC1v1018617C1 [Oldenlandia corymbosa var. corymbosa]|uniref:OLC1v1018617C1 n=1 Tax=Oldenlandia corymbosa var. corymbosa TaxID=529605 RepID=A0AAV1ECE9_OLDCO|nr:OLC1v1018617C1 [Oldenlandia corymbosa var. corymbosa]
MVKSRSAHDIDVRLHDSLVPVTNNCVDTVCIEKVVEFVGCKLAAAPDFFHRVVWLNSILVDPGGPKISSSSKGLFIVGKCLKFAEEFRRNDDKKGFKRLGGNSVGTVNSTMKGIECPMDTSLSTDDSSSNEEKRSVFDGTDDSIGLNLDHNASVVVLLLSDSSSGVWDTLACNSDHFGGPDNTNGIISEGDFLIYADARLGDDDRLTKSWPEVATGFQGSTYLRRLVRPICLILEDKNYFSEEGCVKPQLQNRMVADTIVIYGDHVKKQLTTGFYGNESLKITDITIRKLIAEDDGFISVTNNVLKVAAISRAFALVCSKYWNIKLDDCPVSALGVAAEMRTPLDSTIWAVIGWDC